MGGFEGTTDGQVRVGPVSIMSLQTPTVSSPLADTSSEERRTEVARTTQWMKAHNQDPGTVWWGLAWIAVNVGVVVLLVSLAYTA